VIFPFHLKFTLDPLFENQESGNYPNNYSMHNRRLPNAIGYLAGNDEEQPLEECCNMPIMTLAYAQRTNNTAYLTQHYAILKQWAQ
jgi:Domain of unknown function (DUF4965)